MMRLRVGVDDVQRMRFAFSPLTEVAESLYLLHGGQRPGIHQPWLDMVRSRLHPLDTELLRAIVPPVGRIANLFGGRSASMTATIDDQLGFVAASETDRLRTDFGLVWGGVAMPTVLTDLVDDPRGPQRLADLLRLYWQAALEPYWSRIRGLLDADVAYRTRRLVSGGIEALMADLHPSVALARSAIEVRGRLQSDHDLSGTGLLLVPCAFASPDLLVDPGRTGNPSLVYRPRGTVTLWAADAPRVADDDATSTLLGRTRAAILVAVGRPRTTTDLAEAFQQAPATISAHLTTLRRCGLVTSWRSGRRVLYQRTPLATSVLAASDRVDSTVEFGRPLP